MMIPIPVFKASGFLLSIALLCGCLHESKEDGSSPTGPTDTMSHAGNGLPVPTGLHAKLDAQTGYVHLYWDRMDSPPRDRYYLSHRLEGVPHPSPNPIATTRDTFFEESVISTEENISAISSADTNDYRADYWLRILTTSQELGPSGDTLSLILPSKTWGGLDLSVYAGAYNEVQIKDTVKIHAFFQGPKRVIDSADWMLGGKIIASHRIPPGSHFDSVSFPADTAGKLKVTCKVKDQRGTWWPASVTVEALGQGPPAPTGVEVRYDSLTGAARISWNRSADPQVSGYLVYRTEVVGGGIPYDSLVAVVGDTSYDDRIFSNPDSLRKFGYWDTAFILFSIAFAPDARTRPAGFPAGS